MSVQHMGLKDLDTLRNVISKFIQACVNTPYCHNVKKYKTMNGTLTVSFEFGEEITQGPISRENSHHLMSTYCKVRDKMNFAQFLENTKRYLDNVWCIRYYKGAVKV